MDETRQLRQKYLLHRLPQFKAISFYWNKKLYLIKYCKENINQRCPIRKETRGAMRDGGWRAQDCFGASAKKTFIEKKLFSLFFSPCR